LGRLFGPEGYTGVFLRDLARFFLDRSRRRLATSVHFPDFPLCIMPEKVKENDFPVSLRQG
jgi:hypothetical protein